MRTQELQYEFRVAGRLSDMAQQAVYDVGDPFVLELPPETVICCDVVDPTQLHGIVGRLEDLGLHIVSIRRLSDRYLR